MTTVADFSSEYSLRAALRSAKFPEHAIDAAMAKLFPSQSSVDDETVDWVPSRPQRFEPTAEDWKGYADWFDGVEAQWDRDLLLADRLGSAELRATIEDAKERLRYERTCNARFV